MAIKDVPEDQLNLATKVAIPAATVIFGSSGQDTIITPIKVARATSIDLAPSENDARARAYHLANSLALSGLSPGAISSAIELQLMDSGLPHDVVQRIAAEAAGQTATVSKGVHIDHLGGDGGMTAAAAGRSSLANYAYATYGAALISEITALLNDPNNPVRDANNQVVNLDENGVAEALANKDRTKLVNVKVRATTDTVEPFDAATWARLQKEGVVGATEKRPVHQGVYLGAVEEAYLADALLANAPPEQREALRERIHRLGAGTVVHTMLKENPELMRNLVDMQGDAITNPTLALQAIANGDGDKNIFKPLAIQSLPNGKLEIEQYGPESVILASNLIWAIGDNLGNRKLNVNYAKTLETLAARERDAEHVHNVTNERPGKRYDDKHNFAHLTPEQARDQYRAERHAELAKQEQQKNAADRAR